MAEPRQEDEHRVLLVEDDAEFRDSLAHLLRIRGYDVSCAANGAQAIEQLRKGPEPCVILLDLMMPVMDGWAFRHAMLADPECARIPVVILSGADDVAEEARRLEAAAYLTKPCDTRRVFELLERVC